MFSKKYPVTCNTKNVSKDCTFVAIKGFSFDGNDFIKEAIKLGAKKIVCEDRHPKTLSLCKQNSVKFLHVKNARIALAELSAKSLNIQNIKTKIIGVTGTKGKTSTTYIIEHILRNAGFKTALIGTIINKILDKKFEVTNTTPNSDFLHMFLSECELNKIDFLIMEVSSHALSLYRTHELRFDAVGFTNLAHEHLDFYKTMKNYFKAKQKIFKQLKKKAIAIINTDDNWGKIAFEQIKNKTSAISLNKKTFKQTRKLIPKHMPGEFNLYNFSMAYLICKNLGIPKESIFNGIKNFPGIPGRLQLHTLKNGSRAFVDYAHNPSSVQEVLKTLRPLTKNLITVFGCGGDRDKEKRPLMGNIASKYSDKVIITDDNPRTENSQQIINNILYGIESKATNKTTVKNNRKDAIEYAASISTQKSIIAILGKGHEDYHIVGKKKYHFNDFEEISKF